MISPRLFLSLLLFTVFLFPVQQLPDQQSPHRDESPKLPNGRSQKDEIVKADFEKNLADAQRLVDLSEDLKRALEKNTRFVLSIDDLKKLDEIEKTARRIRSRLKRY